MAIATADYSKIQLHYRDEALAGNIEQIVQAIGTNRPLKHPPSRALVNFAWHYLVENDLEFLVCTLSMQPVLRRHAILGWTNIRMIDELIDSAKADPDQQLEEVQKMEEVFARNSIHNLSSPGHIFEQTLKVYFLLEEKNQLTTIPYMREMASALKWDNQRKGQIPTAEEYNHRLESAVAPIKYVMRFLVNREDELTDRYCYHFGILTQIIDDTLDLYKDLENNLINLSQEEISRAGITDIHHLTSAQLREICNTREQTILRHCRLALKAANEFPSYYERKLFKHYLAYLMQNNAKNQFYPGAPYGYPFESYYKKIMAVKDPMRFENLYKLLDLLAIIFPVSHIPG